MAINIDSEMTNMAILIELGDRVKQARLRLRFSQQEMAAKAGVSLNTIKNAENGGGTIHSFVNILRAMGELESLNQFLRTPEISPLELLKQGNKSKPVQQRVRRAGRAL